MPLTAERKKQLRATGHGLKPVVIVASKGFSDGVAMEIERALNDHELIKVRLAVEDREERKSLCEQIATELRADVVQTVGKIVLLFRAARKPKRKLSNLSH